MKFKTKPVELEAIQWTGENWPDVQREFMHEDRLVYDGRLWIREISARVMRNEEVNVDDYLFYDERQQLCRASLHGIRSKYDLQTALVASEQPEDITEVE